MTVSAVFAGSAGKSGESIHFPSHLNKHSQNHDQERKQKYLANFY